MLLHKIDFFNYLLQESYVADSVKNLYSEILSFEFEENKGKKDEFNKWVDENITPLKTIQTIEEVLPSKAMFDSLVNKGYKHLPSQCHYSAKAISLLDESFEYWTGIVTTNDFFLNFYSHSFNIYHGSIIDFSKINNDLTIVDGIDKHYPQSYFGVKIHTEFVRKYKIETLSKQSMNPLLFEWYSNSIMLNI